MPNSAATTTEQTEIKVWMDGTLWSFLLLLMMLIIYHLPLPLDDASLVALLGRLLDTDELIKMQTCKDADDFSLEEPV